MERGEKINCNITNYHCTAFNNADIHEIRSNSLCGVDGRKQLPATIRQGYTKAYRMVCQEIHTGFI